MAGIGHFVSAQAQADYLRLYDDLIGEIPGQRETRDVETAFGRVRVYRFGPDDDATPIVLLHGRGATSAMWEPNLPVLAAARPVYAIDSLGEPGRSVQTVPISSSQDQADWLREVLDQLGLERVHLAGVSGGGWLAFNLALHAPERLVSISLLEPAHVFAKFSKRFLLGGFALIPGLPDRFGERFLGWVSGGPSMDLPVARLLTQGLRDYRMKLPMPSYGSDAVLRALRVPVLALLGGRSVVHDPRVAVRRAQSLVPDCEAELWPDASHAISGEYPTQISERILRFVSQL